MARPAGVSVPLLFSILVTLLASPARAQEAGATVVLRGSLADNMYVAGGTVDVFAEAERDMVAGRFGGPLGYKANGPAGPGGAWLVACRAG